MDFFSVRQKKQVISHNDVWVFYPEFSVRRFKDLMIRGKSFYAIWDEETSMWSRDETKPVDIVDSAIYNESKSKREAEVPVKLCLMNSYKGGEVNQWAVYQNWLKGMPDNFKTLDAKVTFLSQETTRKDYASKRLPYDLDEEKPEAYNQLMETLYDPKERRKLEWATGAVLNGDGRYIQKMLVLYGPPGSGKSTFLHILEQLLQGYWTTFDAKSLVGKSGDFATHFFKDNPLVAIQHDGQLSKIEDNSLLNSIVSHEDIVVNEKFKAQYTDRANCMLFLGTNSPVKISDSKSGLIRRLIDVQPSGRKVDPKLYYDLMDRIPFELGRIANHCIKVYRHFGKRYYDTYRPLAMMYATDVFFNFVADNRLMLEQDDPMELERIYAIYKDYCEKTNASFISQRYRFREELENYYERYDKTLKNFFGFKAWVLDEADLSEDEKDSETNNSSRWIILDQKQSIFDKEAADFPAQYGNKDEVPFDKWENVTRTLKEIDTSKLHYVKVPENHIVIDFDLKNEKGEKDATKNLDAANKFPPTYAEYSKGGAGIHLHYIYDGDYNSLSRVYSDKGVEIKVFTGNSSLRRKLTFCNNLPIAHISAGLPLKEDKKVVNMEAIQDEQHLRNLIKKCLRKEIHAYTKPSVDYIYKLLEDAYDSDMHYDVRDLRGKVLTFAMGSTHQKDACLKLVNEMKFCSEEASEPEAFSEEAPIVFFDCEVFPNLFIICWKYQGTEDCVRMINPTPKEVGDLFKFRLIGYNNRRYDNHILYARYLGYSNEELFKLSGKIINEKRSDAMFGEAYNISYTDVYDFASAGNKMGLKKYEIELGIHHQENALPWDQPVPEDRWEEVAGYCCNDVIATEAVFNHLEGDWTARQMLAKLSGGTVNDTTNQLTTKFIFGNDKHPKLVYTDLKTGKRSDGTQDPIFFPDYDFVDGKNMFRGEDVGKGGYVWAVPGMYTNVYTFDVAGMHPASIIAMNYFGDYTPRFKEMVSARTHIKHKEFDILKTMLNGVLAEYVVNGEMKDAKAISNALKTGNNSCYGLSSASFPNPMRHPDNKNNIVALRGALTMANLRDILVEKGVQVIHIKTDSIKVVNPSKETMDYIYKYGRKYGYEFEIEHHFDRICLVNNAVYIAKLADDDPVSPGQWTATGAQFAEPYVFKTLFSHEELDFRDLRQIKSVQSNDGMWLDMNESLTDVTFFEKDLEIRQRLANWDNDRDGNKRPKVVYDYLSDEKLLQEIARGHNYQFVGKVGSFIPIKPWGGGGELLVKRDGKFNAVAGTKSYRWLEAEQVKLLSKGDDVDMSYYHSLADAAVEAISQYGDFEWFARN